ncbi:MAG: hypothetical protein WBC22_00675 [Sedimentisphaerales bacterium]
MPDQTITLSDKDCCTPDIGTISGTALLDSIRETIQAWTGSTSSDIQSWTQLKTNPTYESDQLVSAIDPKWLAKAKYDLDRIMKLPDNWDSYGSPSIPEVLYKNAKDFLISLEVEDIEPPFVVPVSGGGIQFEWQNMARELEIEFVQSNVFGYLKIIDDEPVDEGQFSFKDYNSARQLIKWLKTG